MVEKKMDDIQTQLHAIRAVYIAQFPAKLEEIRCYWQSLEANNADRDDMEKLYHMVHSLAGSGATFGFMDISHYACYVERILKICLYDNDNSIGEDQPSIAVLLNQLAEAMTDPQSEEPASVTIKNELPTPSERPEPLVYLLEDDSTLATQLLKQLEHFAYRVRAMSTRDYLEVALSNETPAVLIADIVLPDDHLGGVEAVARIREHHTLDLPTIFLSERDDFEARLQAIRAGGDAYLVKPVNVDHMVDCIDRLIRHEAPEPYRIMIVDDDVTLAEHYALVLRQMGMEVTTVSEPEKALQTIAQVNPELIMMDIHMPGCSGLELAKIIRQQDEYISTPIVYLSTENDLERQFAALHQGGDDFLIKPIEDSYLLSSITHRVDRARKLCALMSQDSLTGLLKHSRIKEQLAAEVSRAKRQQSVLTFVMIDIDHFRGVNDSYGHITGDRVIKSLSRLLKQRLRNSDSIGRYGGEEIAVIMPGTELKMAARVLDELRTDFASILFLHEGKEFSVTLSAGLAGIGLHDTAEQINQAADKALCQAKEQGRNRIVIAEAS